jgi:hypothetical protein
MAELTDAGDGAAIGNSIFNEGGEFAIERTAAVALGAPDEIRISNLKIAENRPAGTVVGSLSTTVAGKIMYELVSGLGANDNHSFTIDNGQLKIKKPLNYELQNRHSIRIRATDENGLYTEQVIVLSVIDRVESRRPMVNVPRQFSVTADTPTPLVFTGVPFTDLVAKASQIFTVSLRVRVGSLSALSTTEVTVSGTPTNLTFKGTLSALNAFFTSPAGLLRYTPLAHSIQSRVIQIRIVKSEGGRSYSSVFQSRIGISTAKTAPATVISQSRSILPHPNNEPSASSIGLFNPRASIVKKLIK